MANKKQINVIKERTTLLLELSKLTQLLHGSWVERYSTCSRPSCECHRGKRHGPRYYLVVNENGRQRQKYVSNTQVQSAQAGLVQYRRLQEIVEKITHLNLTLLKDVNRE